MKKYRIYWLDGKTEEIEGDNISDAFTKAGLGGGALKAMDHFREVLPLHKCKECGKMKDNGGDLCDDCWKEYLGTHVGGRGHDEF